MASLFTLLYLFSPSAFSDPRQPTPSERTFLSAANPEGPRPLPSLQTDAADCDGDIALSVVIPAYNEITRLPVMLSDALKHLIKVYEHGQWEIVIVDDGSRDATSKVALEFANKWHKDHPEFAPPDAIRVVKLTKNRGKGGAVRHGMLHTRGRRILFVDADGASSFGDLAKMSEEMDSLVKDACDEENVAKTPLQRTIPTHPPAPHKLNGSSQVNGAKTAQATEPSAVVVGSRAHMVTSPAVVKRSKLRNALMKGFHTYVAVMGIAHIKDTQCGFKLFTRKAAQAIFPSLHVEGWIFDIEILILASLLHIPVLEVPIAWQEVEGSKMSIIKDSIQMALDLLVIRGSYTIGRWKVKPAR